ncbi:MAG: DivIVA domain-containing protein [Clostridia bacterium]|nr:DivIVA domain-containing protein [Clostridia bacterium]
MIKAENIVNKEFRKALFGYDREDVDKYLDELIAQLLEMEKERKEMASTIEYLVSELTAQGESKPDERVVGPVSPHATVSEEERRRAQENIEP